MHTYIYNTYTHIHTYIHIHACTSLPDHLHRVTTPLYRSLYLSPKRPPIQYIYNDILTPEADILPTWTI